MVSERQMLHRVGKSAQLMVHRVGKSAQVPIGKWTDRDHDRSDRHLPIENMVIVEWSDNLRNYAICNSKSISWFSALILRS